MKKTIIWVAILVFLIINTGCSTTTQQDKVSKPAPPPSRLSTSSSVHLSLGNPSNADAINPNNYLIVKPQYALSYNRDKGIPNWVSWQLNKSWIGSVDRSNDFRPDSSLPDGWYQVTGKEYRGSGYDRGHMTPSGDRTNSEANNSATFLMTNMVPQSPDNNRDYWRELEEYGRDLVEQDNELYIIAGSYGEIKKIGIGKRKVSVPARLYKIVAITKPGSGGKNIKQVIAIDTPNREGKGDWEDFITTVDAIEKKTGYDFLSNVDKSVQDVIEARKYSAKDNSDRSKTTAKQSKNCSPAYPGVCIPAPPPDLNCGDISYRNFKVLPPDPHNFDGNKDGVACKR
ncbi:MAG: DNA/RNA non-specific endonuclease [Cyanobacteria bacterium J06635_10]